MIVDVKRLLYAVATKAARPLYGLVDLAATLRWLARQPDRSEGDVDALVEMLDGCTSPGSLGVWS